MGLEGLLELARFVREGGTLIVEGSASTLFPDYGVTTGITVVQPDQLFVRGSVMRGVVADRASPIAYGYDAQVPVYFSQAPVINVGGGLGAASVTSCAASVTPSAASVTLVPPR